MSVPYKLYKGDWREFINSLDPKSINALISDPPYGVDWDTDYTRFTSNASHLNKKRKSVKNDDKPFDPTPFMQFKKVVLFGANCFSDKLPKGSWFIWDKRFENGKAFLADGEAAWYNNGHGIYIKSVTQQGFVRPEPIEHPTQKPVKIMEWIIEKVTEPDDLVFDPFMGSGTTGVACINTGRRFIGCEIEPEYFAIAERRISQAALQPALFPRSPTKRAPDVGDSPRQQTFSTPEANPLAKGKASPAPRR